MPIRLDATLKKRGRVTATVALESSVFAHGLPCPHNRETLTAIQDAARQEEAHVAVIAVGGGEIHLGLGDDQLARMCDEGETWEKLTFGDLAPAVIRKATGAVTVSGALAVAKLAGIAVSATGGIGGVHRHYAETLDMSADLTALELCGGILVCSGAKAVLDIPATYEALETRGIPVVGFQTDEFPGFYTVSTGIGLSWTADSAEQVVEIYRTQLALNLPATVLVVQPPPREIAIHRADLDEWVQEALREASRREVRGKALTPFLLNKLFELSEGRTLEVNRALLVENVRLAARIARELLRSPETARTSRTR